MRAEPFTIHENVSGRIHNCHLFIIRVSEGAGVTGSEAARQSGLVCLISLKENWQLIATDFSL